MKKLIFLFAAALFASPFVAGATVGFYPCTGDSDCNLQGESPQFCDPQQMCELTQAAAENQAAQNAGNFVPLAPIPGLTDQQPQSNMAAFLNNLYKFLIGFAAAAAVVEIIWGGFEYATQDNVSKKSDGKARITQAVLGLVLVLLPVLVFTIINPNILNLSVNWQAIKLPGQAPGGGGNSGGNQQPAVSSGTSAAIAAGCTVKGTLLQTATCPTSKAAQDFADACDTGTGSVSVFSLQNIATCSTTSNSDPATGPYGFVDTSQTKGLVGLFNSLSGYSYYEPLASTFTNANNGSDVVNFGKTCHADGGTTCLSSIKLPCAQNVVNLVIGTGGGTSATCWAISLSCNTGAAAFLTGTGGCSSDPQFTPIK